MIGGMIRGFLIVLGGRTGVCNRFAKHMVPRNLAATDSSALHHYQQPDCKLTDSHEHSPGTISPAAKAVKAANAGAFHQVGGRA